MKYHFTTSGTCSRSIEIEMDGDVIANVTFAGGCHGNLQGLSALVRGRRPAEVADLLRGINCKEKGTSCPDQLAIALDDIARLEKN